MKWSSVWNVSATMTAGLGLTANLWYKREAETHERRVLGNGCWWVLDIVIFKANFLWRRSFYFLGVLSKMHTFLGLVSPSMTPNLTYLLLLTYETFFKAFINSHFFSKIFFVEKNFLSSRQENPLSCLSASLPSPTAWDPGILCAMAVMSHRHMSQSLCSLGLLKEAPLSSCDLTLWAESTCCLIGCRFSYQPPSSWLKITSVPTISSFLLFRVMRKQRASEKADFISITTGLCPELRHTYVFRWYLSHTMENVIFFVLKSHFFVQKRT